MALAALTRRRSQRIWPGVRNCRVRWHWRRSSSRRRLRTASGCAATMCSTSRLQRDQPPAAGEPEFPAPPFNSVADECRSPNGNVQEILGRDQPPARARYFASQSPFQFSRNENANGKHDEENDKHPGHIDPSENILGLRRHNLGEEN